jgi:hypothetical protein
MSTMTAMSAVNGSKLLEACNYDRRLCGAVIASEEDNWKELLESISTSQMRRNVAIIVWQIREALGKDFDYAKEIAQGPQAQGQAQR